MYKCPYCNCDLEPCSGGNVLGICPVCREIWSEDFYIDVMNNPCLKCKSTKVKIREYKLSYICLECEEQWLECEEQWIKTHNGLKGLTPEIHAIDFDTLMIAIKEELQAADKEHGPMLEPIEGWYTTLCEITEWQREIFRVTKEPEAAQKECIQSICMHIKWMRDCLPMMIEEIKEKEDGNT